MPIITKTITSDERLALLALWVCAKEHYAKALEFEGAMRRRLGDDVFDQHVGDSIYTTDSKSVDTFDDALTASGVSVDG